MFGTSKIQLSQSAIQSNIKFIKSQIGKRVRLSGVIKANAYGHGLEEYIPVAEQSGIHHFSVFSADEALRALQVKKPRTKIMIMGHMDPEEIPWAIEHGIEFYLFDEGRLLHTIETAKQMKKVAKVHLEFETGMHRTGFVRRTLGKHLGALREFVSVVDIQGVCTHYAGAESIANHVRVQKQFATFNRMYNWLLQNGITPKYRHTACSAAVMTYPKTQMDMVRVGILQYGFWPSRETFIHYAHKNRVHEDPLKRVISWISNIMSVQEVSDGDFIGYGTSFIAQRKMRVAVVPVGYAHGYSRSLSNQGRVLICGEKANAIGFVNMNMLLVDVTHIPHAKRGDEVVLIGTQGDLTISVASFGEFSDQLNYELLARLPLDIPREVVK
jgi:alanine racemase